MIQLNDNFRATPNLLVAYDSFSSVARINASPKSCYKVPYLKWIDMNMMGGWLLWGLVVLFM